MRFGESAKRSKEPDVKPDTTLLISKRFGGFFMSVSQTFMFVEKTVLQDLAVSVEPGNKNHLPEILFGTRRDIHK